MHNNGSHVQLPLSQDANREVIIVVSLCNKYLSIFVSQKTNQRIPRQTLFLPHFPRLNQKENKKPFSVSFLSFFLSFLLSLLPLILLIVNFPLPL